MNKCFDTLISLIRESPLGLSFNGLIDAFARECVLTNQTYCVERIVQNLNYSPRYVCSVIKRNLGITPVWLQNIMYSQIFDDGDSLSCVVENGFYDQTHLNKNIRKLTGLSYISFKSQHCVMCTNMPPYARGAAGNLSGLRYHNALQIHDARNEVRVWNACSHLFSGKTQTGCDIASQH